MARPSLKETNFNFPGQLNLYRGKVRDVYEIEDKLQIECSPLSWPIGMGKSFKGVYNIYRKELRLFTPGSETRAQDNITLTSLDDPQLRSRLAAAAREASRRYDVATCVARLESIYEDLT